MSNVSHLIFQMHREMETAHNGGSSISTLYYFEREDFKSILVK